MLDDERKALIDGALALEARAARFPQSGAAIADKAAATILRDLAARHQQPVTPPPYQSMIRVEASD